MNLANIQESCLHLMILGQNTVYITLGNFGERLLPVFHCLSGFVNGATFCFMFVHLPVTMNRKQYC